MNDLQLLPPETIEHRTKEAFAPDLTDAARIAALCPQLVGTALRCETGSDPVGGGSIESDSPRARSAVDIRYACHWMRAARSRRLVWRLSETTVRDPETVTTLLQSRLKMWQRRYRSK